MGSKHPIIEIVFMSLCKHGIMTTISWSVFFFSSSHQKICCHTWGKWIMLTYGWKQWWKGMQRKAMKNHAVLWRRGSGAVPLSPLWQVYRATWQHSISVINAVGLGLPFTKLRSVLGWYFKVKWIWKSRTTQLAKKNEGASASCLLLNFDNF